MRFIERFKPAVATTAPAVLALAVLALALGAGCASTPSSSSSAPPPQQAVLLTTGNGTTSVVLPKSEGGVTYLSSGPKSDHCPQCESDIGTYFKTGQLAQKCSVCGATRTTLTGTN